MKISARQMDSTTIFDISGNIDLSNSPEVRKAFLREMRDNHTPRVLVNLQDVKYIDSSGIASLVEGLKASRETGAKFILYGLTPGAREVLQISRLLQVFDVCESEEQALQRSAAAAS